MVNTTTNLGPPPVPPPFPSPPGTVDLPIVFEQEPPFPAPPRTVDLSSLEFVLALIAIITIPALIYTFFFAIKCPSSPFRRRDRSHESDSIGDNIENISNTDSISGVKYQKEAHVKDIGSECPVCLSVFADGEEVRQLSVCKHSFHASCIDMWLNSHSNCPICRASVPVKRPNGTVSGGNYDLQQGLPDAGSLV